MNKNVEKKTCGTHCSVKTAAMEKATKAEMTENSGSKCNVSI